MSLKDEGVDAFVARTLQLVHGYRYKSSSPPAAHLIVCYSDFIDIAFKLSRLDVQLDAIERPSQRPTSGWTIVFSGQTRRLSLNRVAVWTLYLNDAIRKGVQPEQVREFRKRFGVDGEDSWFFQRSNTPAP